jgi:thiol-disulfide isomerase/thioredoxin
MATQAPEFHLVDLRGNTIDSDYGARPVTIVHFWASWCVPCMREIPDLNRMAAIYEPSGAALFAVALSSGSAGDLRQLERAYNIRHRVLVGNERLATDFGGIPSFPTTYLVDRRGRVVERHVGATPEVRKRIEASVDALLLAAKAPAPKP